MPSLLHPSPPMTPSALNEKLRTKNPKFKTLKHTFIIITYGIRCYNSNIGKDLSAPLRVVKDITKGSADNPTPPIHPSSSNDTHSFEW